MRSSDHHGWESDSRSLDQFAPDRIPGPGTELSSSAGVIVSERSAQTLVDFYACVTLIADSLAMLPWQSHRKSGDVRELVGTQPTILTDPHPEPGVDAITWRTQMLWSYLVRGNAIAVITDFDRGGQPSKALPVHPDSARVYRDKDTNKLRYDIGTMKGLTPFDVIHIRGYTPPGSLVGLSVVDTFRRAIGLGIATEEFGASWFADGAAPSSQLYTDQQIGDDERKKMLAQWVASNAGRRRPVFLTGGVKWEPVTITPEESQFLETMGMNTSRIARMFRVPPHMIGHVEKTTSWGTGIEEQGISYVVFTLGAHIARFEQAITYRLPRPQYLKVNVAALQRGATKDRYLGYAVGRQWGWLSGNDIRRLEDLPPIDGGDTYLQPLNMIDAEQALKILLDKNAGGTP